MTYDRWFNDDFINKSMYELLSVSSGINTDNLILLILDSKTDLAEILKKF